MLSHILIRESKQKLCHIKVHEIFHYLLTYTKRSIAVGSTINTNILHVYTCELDFYANVIRKLKRMVISLEPYRFSTNSGDSYFLNESATPSLCSCKHTCSRKINCLKHLLDRTYIAIIY